MRLTVVDESVVYRANIETNVVGSVLKYKLNFKPVIDLERVAIS